jgi:NADH-quinone oxidoreductase subunit H
MPELLAVPALLLLTGGAVAVRAVLAGRATGLPASLAVLAPAAEAARAVRTLPPLPPGGAAVRIGAVGLLATAVARVLLLPLGGTPLLDPPAGLPAWLVLDLLAWLCWAPLGRHRGALGRLVLQAVAVELPVAAALAAPAVAAGTVRIAAVTGQEGPPAALQMPVAPLVLLAVLGLLAPWSAPLAPSRPASGLDRLLLGTGRAAALVAGLAGVAAVFLGRTADPAGLLRLVVATVLLVLLVEVAARRFPVLRDEQPSVVAIAVLLPLALLQLAVVAALALLAAA